jgi:hypothetical protein
MPSIGLSKNLGKTNSPVQVRRGGVSEDFVSIAFSKLIKKERESLMDIVRQDRLSTIH